MVEVEAESLPPNGKGMGIDLALATLATTSDSEKISPPKLLRSALRRLRRLQRSLSCRAKGSRNRRKALRGIAQVHVKVADKRLDVLPRLGTGLLRENQTVVAEDLNVSGMLKNRKPARSIKAVDAGWRQFRTLLESNAEQCGRQVVVLNRWLPTSQTCSACGHRDGTKPLSVRHRKCPACGAEYDRDINAAKNAAKNILAAGAEAATHLNQGVR